MSENLLQVTHDRFMDKYMDILNILESPKVTNLLNHPCSNIFKKYLSITMNDIKSSFTQRFGISLIIRIIVFLFLSYCCLELWIISLIIAKLPLINKLTLFLTIQTIKLHMVVKIKYLEKLYGLVKFKNPTDEVLLKRIDQCKTLKSELNLNFVFIIVNVLVKIVVALGTFNGLLSFVKASALEERVMIFCFIVIILLPIILLPFICKRVFLIKNNVYNTEKDLFEIIKNNHNILREDPKEWQWDFIIYIVNYISRYFLVSIVFTYLLEYPVTIREDAFEFIIAVICFTILFKTRTYEHNL
jgi:hypothetical protein